MSAVSLPRRAMPIRSPLPARSTSSESFCLASNNPTVRIDQLRLHLDDSSRSFWIGRQASYMGVLCLAQLGDHRFAAFQDDRIHAIQYEEIGHHRAGCEDCEYHSRYPDVMVGASG